MFEKERYIRSNSKTYIWIKRQSITYFMLVPSSIEFLPKKLDAIMQNTSYKLYPIALLSICFWAIFGVTVTTSLLSPKHFICYCDREYCRIFAI